MKDGTNMQASKEALTQNLKDAGCDAALIDRCVKAQHRSEVLHMLAAHRCSVLDAVHDEQDRLDCLDYLIYKIRNEQEKSRDGE